MPRLSNAQDAARRRVHDLAARGLPPERLAAGMTTAVEAAIGWDGFRLFGVDPGTLLVNRLLAASAEDGWARLEWLREVYLAAGPLDFIELPHLMRANRPAVAFQDRQELCWGYPPDVLGRLSPGEHHRRFHELRSPVGGTLLAGFAAGGRWVAALQAYRRDALRPFRAGDVAFLRLLAPAIGRALAAALARERAAAQPRTADDPAGDAAGILLLEADGRLRFATPAGERWRDRLADADPGGDGLLPTAVHAAVAGLRAGTAPALALLAPTAGGDVRVEASPAGPDGSVAVVLAPVRPPPAPGVPADWPLTPQERQVVDLLVGGASNRAIAERLRIAEHTVEWHLRHAYAKLGVGGRTQLLARLFRQTHLPAVAADRLG